MAKALEMNELIKVVKNFNKQSTKQFLIENVRHPLANHKYHEKTNAELEYIVKDAGEAAKAMQGHDSAAEHKYLDQVNDATTVLAWRRQNGMPNWYKTKYNLWEASVVTLNGKDVDTATITVDGIDRRDHPDYVDAYFSYAEFTDGTELSDEELEQLGDENHELLYQMIIDDLFESKSLEEISKVGTALGAAGMAAAALAGAGAPAAAQTPNVRPDIFIHHDQGSLQKNFAADISAAMKALPSMTQKLQDIQKNFNDLTPVQKQLVANLQTGMKLPSDVAKIANWINFTARNVDLASQM
jgi:hypothetical protein